MESLLHYKKFNEAHQEVQRRKALPDGEMLIHRIMRSPYGGYIVKSIDPEFYLDAMVDGPRIHPSSLWPKIIKSA